MKLLVTGGAGFIGANFVDFVLKNRDYEIVVFDKLTYAGDMERLRDWDYDPRLTFYKFDIIDRNSLEEIFSKEQINAIIHFAAESHVDRSIHDATPFVDTNIKGTQVLLDLALKHKIERFIHISTDEVYGELGLEGKFFEDMPLNPSSPYSASKAAADLLIKSYIRTHQFPAIIIRPCNNYGPWQYPEKFIPVIIYKAMKNEKIPVYGQGLNIREWLYVEDCCNGILEIFEKGKIGEVYNIGSGAERKNIEIVKAILQIINKPESLIEFVSDRPGHDFRYSLETKKVKNDIAWKPSYSFEKGIEKTVQWNLENLNWIERKILFLKELWEKVYR
jgi:dTDP-glucose 4,6-dehydratase